jgi:hypothetical protein
MKNFWAKDKGQEEYRYKSHTNLKIISTHRLILKYFALVFGKGRPRKCKISVSLAYLALFPK